MTRRAAKMKDLERKEAMVVVAHPDPISLNHALAHAVVGALTEAGMDPTLFDLHAEGFDPVLTRAEARGAASDDRQVQLHIDVLKRASFLAVMRTASAREALRAARQPVEIQKA